jgi:hypothetical protein
VGTPKTAITSSPTRFSTVPPWRSIPVSARPDEVREERLQYLDVRSFSEFREADHIAEVNGDYVGVSGSTLRT